MKNYLVTFAILCAAFLPWGSARAQAEPAYIVGHTTPVDQQTIDRVDVWLAENPPLPVALVKYYAITCNDQVGSTNSRFICIAALNIQNPEAQWTIFSSNPNKPRNGIWFATLILYPNGTIQRYDTPESVGMENVFKRAMPITKPLYEAGGGSYVRFPWEPGKAVMYNGSEPCIWDCEDPVDARTVNFRSGDDYGTSAANDSVYASVTGSIAWVCESFGNVSAVRIDGSGDSFFYGGLVENANLTVGHSFNVGEIIATLAHGSYTNTCDGVVVQASSEWSWWWGVIMKSDDTFVAENAVLAPETAGASVFTWTCRDIELRKGDTITHCDGTGSGGANSESFWSYMIDGFYGMFDAMYTNLMPENQSADDLVTPLINSAKVVIRIAAVLMIGNFNLGPAVAMISVAIAMRSVIGVIQIIGAIIRIVKSIPFVP